MTYAQKDYSQTLGNGHDSIASSGSFLVAISNLLTHFGYNVSPIELNDVFKERQAFVGVDDLTVGSISSFDPRIAVNSVGNGAPDFADSIVKLKYKSVTGEEMITYAAVVDAAAGTIIDSFDGLEKNWAIYGGPVTHITFARYNPMIITPLTAKRPQGAPEAPAETSAATYTLVTAVKAYGTAESALAHGTDAVAVLNPGEYFIFDEVDGILNIAQESVKFGHWIDPRDNIVAAELPAEEATPETELTPIPEESRIVIDLDKEDEIDLTSGIYAEDAWKNTYKEGSAPIEAIAIEETVIHDLAGIEEDKVLKLDARATIVGKFEVNGDIYFRTDKSVAAGHWYGIPRGAVRRVVDIVDEDEEEAKLDNLLNSIAEEEELSKRDKLLRAAATAEGKFSSILKLGKKTN